MLCVYLNVVSYQPINVCITDKVIKHAVNKESTGSQPISTKTKLTTDKVNKHAVNRESTGSCSQPISTKGLRKPKSTRSNHESKIDK